MPTRTRSAMSEVESSTATLPSEDIVDRLRKRAAAFGVPKVSPISTTGSLLKEAADVIEALREAGGNRG